MVNLTKKPAAAANGGIVEGDYTSWSFKWVNSIPYGLYNKGYLGFFIDEINEVINIAWVESNTWYQFMICNISDFSTVFQHPAGSDYISRYPEAQQGDGIRLGAVGGGGMSRAIQTYILLLRPDEKTLEVWRGGSSPLWSHDVTIDQSPSTVWVKAISLSGKWILVSTTQAKLILYEA